MTDLTARTDGELLREFARTRAGEPFAEMVRRHGAMVHGVCRRVAGRDDLAEDAANAAFLVLARKAAAVGSRPDAGGWLHRVADHVARRARDAERRRAFHERRAAAMKTAGDGIEAVDREEILRNVDAALGTLRGGERAVVVGLYLEGRTRKELAAALGLPEGTVASRSASALEKLRRILCHRGMVVSAAGLGAILVETADAASVPASFASLPALASGFAATKAAGTAGAGLLAKEVLNIMLWTKLSVAAGVVAAVTGIGVVTPAAYRAVAGDMGDIAGKTVSTQTVLVELDLWGSAGGVMEMESRGRAVEAFMRRADVRVVQKVRKHLWLLDCGKADPFSVLNGCPHRQGAMILEEGNFKRGMAYENPYQKGQFLTPRPYGRVSWGSGSGDVKRMDTDVARYSNMPGIVAEKINTLPGKKVYGNSWMLKLTPGAGKTILDVFLMTDAGFDYEEIVASDARRVTSDVVPWGEVVNGLQAGLVPLGGEAATDWKGFLCPKCRSLRPGSGGPNGAPNATPDGKPCPECRKDIISGVYKLCDSCAAAKRVCMGCGAAKPWGATFVEGEPIRLEFHKRNTGKQELQFNESGVPHRWLVVFNPKDQDHEVPRKVAIDFVGGSNLLRIPSGRESSSDFTFFAFSKDVYEFKDKDARDDRGGSPRPIKTLLPGKYTVTASYEYNEPQEQTDGLWRGKVSTGAVEIEVKPKGVIAWGEIVNGLQAGLVPLGGGAAKDWPKPFVCPECIARPSKGIPLSDSYAAGNRLCQLCHAAKPWGATFVEGEPIGMEIHLQNKGDARIGVDGASLPAWKFVFTSKDGGVPRELRAGKIAEGAPPPAPGGPGSWVSPLHLSKGESEGVVFTIPPKPSWVFEDARPATDKSLPPLKNLPAGEYRVVASYERTNAGSFWTGKVSTGVVEIEIKPKGAGAQSEAGEIVNGLRLALKMTKARYAVDERWDGELRVDNVTGSSVFDTGRNFTVHLERDGGGDTGVRNSFGGRFNPKREHFVVLDRDPGRNSVTLRPFDQGQGLTVAISGHLSSWVPPPGTYRIWFTYSKMEDDGAKYGVAGKVWTGEIKSNVVTVEVGEVKGAAATDDLAALIANLSSKDGVERAAASKRLFELGSAALPALEKAGARGIATISPLRIDVIYSLIKGLKGGSYAPDGLGVRVESGTTKEDLVAMGRKHGFTLDGRFSTTSAPSAYVQLQGGKMLTGVMKELLSDEPQVVTVSLNYVKR